jgi:hypothetical protein
MFDDMGPDALTLFAGDCHSVVGLSRGYANMGFGSNNDYLSECRN